MTEPRDTVKYWSELYQSKRDENAGDFEKWFKIIGFNGLTGYQPECAIIIDDSMRLLAQVLKPDDATVERATTALVDTLMSHGFWLAVRSGGYSNLYTRERDALAAAMKAALKAALERHAERPAENVDA